MLLLFSRGTSNSKASPFREWYGHLVDFKSLLSAETRFALFTATATVRTRYTIYEMLGLSPTKTFCIEINPMRENILYIFQYINKEQSMETIFRPIIEEVYQNKERTVRTLIFCQTRKHCALLYRMFNIHLGDKMYIGNELDPKKRLIDMFHAGTPENVKGHIVNEMANSDSVLRILICTSAFGMGINCKMLSRSIHFGPPTTIEALIQETGRLGRDGEDSISYVLYNGLLASRCDNKVKQLVQTESCYRLEIGRNFSSFPSDITLMGCKCCNVCCINCDCGPSCTKGSLHFNLFDVTLNEEAQQSSSPGRKVSDSQKIHLKSKLACFKDKVKPACLDYRPVSCSTV